MSGGSIKLANKKFTTIPNDYCISFDTHTKFDPAGEDVAIGKTGYAFKTIESLGGLQPKSSVDIIGLVTDVTPVTQVKLRSGEEKDRRTITIADDSGSSVDITFWGAAARAQGLQVDKIVAVKDCRVSDYKGVSLNGPNDGRDVKVEDQIGHPRLAELRKWIKSHPKAAAHSLTEKP